MSSPNKSLRADSDLSASSTRVLVVDDEAPIAESLCCILRNAGFEAECVYSGEAAIEAARRFRPDILLADYYMPPGIDGFEACTRIMRILPACRIVMLSAHSLSDRLPSNEPKSYKFVLLQKPMHPAELLKALRAEEFVPAETPTPARVLNVDDVEAHRYSLSRLLAHAGFEVREAETGTDALQKARESKPDLVLLDIHLPDYDGYQVCSTLKQQPETARIVVVHVTNSETSAELARRSTLAGADEYLAFPYVPSYLIRRIRELLQLRYLKEHAG